MFLKEVVIPVKKTIDQIQIYPIGDTHVGNRSCAEGKLKKLISQIHTPEDGVQKFWIGGGDLLDAVIPPDNSRFDFDVVPDWMIQGQADDVRDNLNDMLTQQFRYTSEIFRPITGGCLGLIEGNHEFQIRKRHNENIQQALCNRLDTENLTDEALIRLKFVYKKKTSSTVILYIRHGYGGGRSEGAEPNKLAKMRDEWEIADILLSGHTHTHHIMPPKAVMSIPRKGKLPDKLRERYRYAANWGCFIFSHKVGASSYATRACYPARPLVTCRANINPFKYDTTSNNTKFHTPHIDISEVKV